MRFRNWIKLRGREKRHKRIRNKIAGTASKPRLSVFRSTNNLYAQFIDDTNGKTLLALSTMHPQVKSKVKSGGNVEAARILGDVMAGLAKEKGFKKVVFDRSGYLFHGRVKALAEAARKGGLEF